jgi:hypothetical protein
MKVGKISFALGSLTILSKTGKKSKRYLPMLNHGKISLIGLKDPAN